MGMLIGLPKGYENLDAGIPWIPYWITQALEILSVRTADYEEEVKSWLLKYLKNLIHKDGGFMGNIGYERHIASTYGGLCAIVNLGTPEAYDLIDW